MSFELNQHRKTVAFDLPTGAPISSVDLSKITCILDIYSNVPINMDGLGFHEFDKYGNFSTWVSLKSNQAVAVTGLTSCGAVFIANGDFTRVAAGHMSGDAQFVAGWCEKLKSIGRGIEPSYILWGTGTDGSRRTGGSVLAQYGEFFNIPLTRAPDVVSCGAILLARSPSGSGVAYASYLPDISFRRAGQAVREDLTLPDKESQAVIDFETLNKYNTRTVMDQMMLIVELGRRLWYQPQLMLVFDDDSQEKMLSSHGKIVAQKYLAGLPANCKNLFLEFEIFKLHPDWKPSMP
jgi:hypothetical protein